MRLPEPIAGWSPVLDAFPRDIGLAVAAMVRRIEPALGPFRVSRPEPTGQLDGYDGIARRGAFERLLVSEWALADAVPGEFLRRAAAGELAFLRHSFTTPASSRGSLALVDMGPLQMGSPRIGQLALLVALARRAQRGGAAFSWGIIGCEDPLREGMDPVTLAEVLLGRPGPPHRFDSAGCPALTRDCDDIWVIGAHRTLGSSVAATVGLVEVRDCLEPDLRALDIVVRPRQRPATELRLELPDDASCVRLLRDPFGTATQVRAQPSPSKDFEPHSNFVFAQGRQKLMARVATGVAVYPVPNSPRGGVGRMKAAPVPDAGELLAVGWLKRQVLHALLREDSLVLVSHRPMSVLGARSARVFPLDEGLMERIASAPERVSGGATLGRIVASYPTPQRLLVELPGGVLVRLSPTLPDPESIATVATEVVAWAEFGTMLAYVSTAIDAGRSRYMLTWPDAPSEERLAGLVVGARGAFLTYHRRLCAALSSAGSTWCLIAGGGTGTLHPPGELEVCGVYAEVDRLGLLVLEPDRRTFAALGRDFYIPILRTAHAVTRYSVSDDSSHLACLTSGGELLVASVWKQQVLVRTRLREGGAA